MEQQFTISMLTEKQNSAILRVIGTLGRHRLEVSSVSTAVAGNGEFYRHTVVVRAAPDRVRRAVKQLGAALGVLQAECYGEGETLDRELALYKLSVDLGSAGGGLQRAVRRAKAKVVLAGPDYVVVEKTGSGEEIEELLSNLEPFGVMEFVRSGQTIVTLAALHKEVGTE